MAMALAAPFLWAQAPDQARGIVDGKPVTQAQMEALINLVPPEQRGPLSADPQEMLRFYGFIQRMSEFADKDKLAEQSPYKEQLELGRKFVLAMAEMSEKGKAMTVSTADEEKYYEEHKDSFTTAYVTVAQVQVKNEADAAGAKATADALWKKVQAGGDFDAIAKEYPVGEFKSFKKSDNVPTEIKEAVFQLKPGQVTKPLVRPNGVFLVRLDKVEVKSLQDARGDVLKAVQDGMYQKWMDGIRKSVVIGK
jgi:parvulin-like peptidyl-prolyl isomerase